MIVSLIISLLTWKTAIALLLGLVVFKVITWLQSPLRKIPGPKGHFLLGNLRDLASPNDPLQCFVKWKEQYGDVFKIWSPMAGEYVVYISNPDYIKKITVQDSTSYHRPDHVRKLFGNVFNANLFKAKATALFSANGKVHAMQRKMLNPAFSYASVQKFIPIFNDKAEQLIKLWEKKIDKSEDKDIEDKVQRSFTNLTLDIIGESSFGYDFNSINGKHSEESQATDKILRAQFDISNRIWEKFFPFLKLFPSKTRDEVINAVSIFQKLIYRVVEQRRDGLNSEDSSKHNDLLQLMFEMVDDESEKMNNDDLFAQVNTFMIAGHETTSMAMTWTILLLSKYPDVQCKVQEEIRGIIDRNEEPTYDKLCKMKYLDNCIKESMRLYPPAVHAGRISLKDVQIGPYTLPKGTTVFLAIACSHRDAEFWKDPADFNPDRFDQQDAVDQSVFSYRYLPFSRGPRMCIGYRFAELELKTVLAKLLRSLTFKLGKNQSADFKAEWVLTLRPNPAPVVAISKVED